MISENKKWEELQRMAESLFDGDREKAEKLILLIQNIPTEIPAPPEFAHLKMELPVEPPVQPEPAKPDLSVKSCRWCFDGECFYYMPDSLFLCKGKCSDYEEKVEEII